MLTILLVLPDLSMLPMLQVQLIGIKPMQLILLILPALLVQPRTLKQMLSSKLNYASTADASKTAEAHAVQ